jgi:hypothetical protein
MNQLTEFDSKTQVTTPGLYLRMPAAVYHSDPCPSPSLSSGVLRTLLEKSIEHAALKHPRFGKTKRDATPSMNLGTVTHALLAGDESDLAGGNFDSYRSKDAQNWKRATEESGRVPVLARDLDDARPVVSAVRNKAAVGITNDPFAAHGCSEVSAIWKEDDFYFRARFDRLLVDPTGHADIWDWKTADDVSPRAIERSIIKYGYHIQAAFYLRGLTALLPDYKGRTSFIFVFVETSAPYHVRRVVLSQTLLAIGKKKANEGIAQWIAALASGNFSAPPFETLEIEAPAFLEDDEIATA